jgi:hypothetical protein
VVGMNVEPVELPDDEYYDDRMDRWMEVNGITHMGFATYHDGHTRVVYTRADGSEVIPALSYGYDEKLTPYSKVAGHA